MTTPKSKKEPKKSTRKANTLFQVGGQEQVCEFESIFYLVITRDYTFEASLPQGTIS